MVWIVVVLIGLIDIFALNFLYNYRTKTAWLKLLANDPSIILVIASLVQKNALIL